MTPAPRLSDEELVTIGERNLLRGGSDPDCRCTVCDLSKVWHELAATRAALATAQTTNDSLRTMLAEAVMAIDGGGAYCSDCDRGSSAPQEWRDAALSATEVNRDPDV